jgi:hypothetical protein
MDFFFQIDQQSKSRMSNNSFRTENDSTLRENKYGGRWREPNDSDE